MACDPRSAHAAGAPWEGVNAQDAVVLAYNNISALRQQISPSHRVHGIIQGSEHWVQNIIPATSSASFGVRAPTQAELDVLRPKVENCFRAAALATGCKLKITDHMAYKDLRNSAPLADQYRRYMKHRQDVEMTAAGALGSTDFVRTPHARDPLASQGADAHVFLWAVHRETSRTSCRRCIPSTRSPSGQAKGTTRPGSRRARRRWRRTRTHCAPQRASPRLATAQRRTRSSSRTARRTLRTASCGVEGKWCCNREEGYLRSSSLRV